MNQIKNPTSAQFVALIDSTENETVNGVLSTSDGTIAIADCGSRPADMNRLADDNGIGDFLSFTINKDWNERADYRIDFPAAFMELDFLRAFSVDVATVGVVPALGAAA